MSQTLVVNINILMIFQNNDYFIREEHMGVQRWLFVMAAWQLAVQSVLWHLFRTPFLDKRSSEVKSGAHGGLSCVQIPPDLRLHSVEKELKISLLRLVDVCVLTQMEKIRPLF